ncbi:response regulator [Streptomyces sp. NPDC020192]|uniref:response regulator n=1 Tax=Streptomyces sp. NPDC020192 TaxID=3365066 RepID=UPI003795325C
MIRIVLADDHPVVREGLRAMLSAEPDLEVVGDAASGPRAEALAAELRPDIVLMDLRMPGGGGVDSIVRMTAAGLPCRVIVLTTYETDRDILRAVEAGAAGYLLCGDRPPLFIGESTVKTHLLRILGKLEVDDRTATVTRAMRYGLLEQ